MLKVIFYKTEAGNEPARDFLRDLDPEDRKIIGADLRTVELGWPLGMPLCRKLVKGIYEVRSDISDKRIVRLVFFQHEKNIIVIHGFIKKTQTTPDDVLKLSKKRKAEYEKNEEKLQKN
jgi:phage-related protein